MSILFVESEQPQGDGDGVFDQVRRGIIGYHQTFRTPYGMKKLIYADWCASGRLYAPIERFMSERIGPYVGNTHTESNVTGASMTHAYQCALRIIKRHVNAGPRDAIITTGTGMTGAVNKLQRLMGLRIPAFLQNRVRLAEAERPVIFVTHMEHHSNQLSWQETFGDVVIVPPSEEGLVDPRNLARILMKYRNRPYKIGAFTACSNVTGIRTPMEELAKVMHRFGGLCVADYSASAPYVRIDMRPSDPAAQLDAVLFSPHKFLGGPGTNGVLVFDSRLAISKVPDHPGGGTVKWTDPWGGKLYVDQLEDREDGGTPGFLQAIRTALCTRLKEQMGIDRMEEREHGMLERLWKHLDRLPRLRVLEERHRNRKAIISFTVDGLHYKLVTRLLNDRYGIQARGGCSCAGSYGHYLFGIGPEVSQWMHGQVAAGNKSLKPGWTRISLHPAMSDGDVDAIGLALTEITANRESWREDYVWDDALEDYRHMNGSMPAASGNWFDTNLFE